MTQHQAPTADKVYPQPIEPARPDAVNTHHIFGCNAFCSGEVHATISYRNPRNVQALGLTEVQASCDRWFLRGVQPDIEVTAVELALEHPPDDRDGWSKGWPAYLLRWRYRTP